MITAFQLSLGSSQEFKVNNDLRIVVKLGDITTCRVDAIVNAANEQLAGGGGVCGAIFDAAGWDDLQRSCDQYPALNGIRCPVGQARITESFGLKKVGINYIIHAVGPDCRVIKDAKEQDLFLEQAYKNALVLADQHGLTSIAFPFISSAIYAFPKDRAALIAVNVLLNYVRNCDTKLKSIYLVLFSWQDFNLFCDVLIKNTPLNN